MKGLYGRPPREIEPDIMKKIIGNEKPITHRPADDIEPVLPKAIENLDSSLIEHEEDIISYCLFPETALEYFKWRKLLPDQRPPAPVELELQKISKAIESEKPEVGKEMASDISQTTAEESFMRPEDYQGLNDIMKKVAELNINELVIRKGDATISLKADSLQNSEMKFEILSPSEGEPEKIDVTTSQPEEVSKDTQIPVATDDIDLTNATTIDSPLAGNFYGAPAPGKPRLVNIGDTVKAGDTVCIVEAMKLINEISASVDCTIVNILVKDGESVEKGQPLMVIEKL